ncbi:MAG: acetyltransferase [Acidobacteria bacterium]|nr:acetyltransferase [Acidobacteriota bacterium]
MRRLAKTTLAGVWIAAVGPLASWGQQPMNGGSDGVVRVQNTDLAVLEAGDPRKDLPCEVVSEEKAFLGFDLRFHTGYDVTVPLRELAGNENLLTILFRVAPKTKPEHYQYFIQRIRVPEVDEDAKGDAVLQGAFDLGEGEYKVDWLIRDRAERVCSSSWAVQAELPAKDKQIALSIAPQAVEAMRQEQFHEEAPVQRATAAQTAAAGDPINIKLLVNFAPQKATAASLRPLDTLALVSILRQLYREPKIGKFSVVAFNLNEQKVIYRQADSDRIHFQDLGESLKQLNPGTVRLTQLAEKHSDTNFLATLIASEAGRGGRHDALVFAGPKAMLEANIPEDSLRQVGELPFPVFYMNYILNPQATPWRDAIGNAVKFFKGTEFTISRPRDLWYAVTDMVSRIVKTRNGKQIAAVQPK